MNAILLIIPAITSFNINCQVRLSATISSGIDLNIVRKPNEMSHKYSVSPILGVELGALFYSRVGLSFGYFHSQTKTSFYLPPIQQNIELIYSVRYFPTSFELVVWNDTKNIHNVVDVVPDKYISVKIGSLNILKQVAFGKDNLLKNRIDIDEFTYHFNQQNFNTLKIQKNTLEKKIDFFKSPFIGVKYKLKDRKQCSISFETLYGFDLVPYNDVAIFSKPENSLLSNQFSSHIFQFRVNFALIYDN